MKIQSKKNIQSKIAIGLAINMICSAAMAAPAGTGVGFRPSLRMETKAPEAAQDLENPVVAAKRANMNETTLRGLKMNLSPAALDNLPQAMVKNRGLVSAITNISHENADNVRAINELRIEILNLTSNIDIADPAQRTRAESDVHFQHQFDLVRLVATINPRGVSGNTRANVEFYFKQIKSLLDAKVPADRVLELASEATLAEKGFNIDVESISGAITSGEGAIALFKGIDEERAYEIGTAGGQVLKLRMTAKQLEDMENEVNERVEDLLALARNPREFDKLQSSKALKQLNAAAEDVTLFTKNNTILDASSKTSQDARTSTAEVQTSVDELLRELQVLGHAIGGESFKNSFLDTLRSLPMGKKFIGDRVDRIKTAREKIGEIDKALVNGANKMEANNQQLTTMKSLAINRMVTLQTEMARAKMALDFLKQYAEHFTQIGDQTTANTINQEILLRLERELSASLILYGTMATAIATIDALVSSNEVIIANANDVRRVAIPAIAIQETLKTANQQTRQVMLQQKAVAAYLKTLTVENVELLRQNAELLKETMSNPIMEAAIIGKAIQDLVEIQNKSLTDREEAAKTMAVANNEMITVVNQINGLHMDSVGSTVNKIFRK
jgi:hypothetical protein